MKIKILGAHNTESRHTRQSSLLVDDILALDAGGLTSGLTFQSQARVKAVLLTHAHYDHIRDIPALAMNLYLREKSVHIYTHQAVYDGLTQHLLNGSIYPAFHTRPAADPTLKFHILEPYREVMVEGYTILPVPVIHAVPAMGYQVTSADGKSAFYTGDTGANLSDLWNHISPQVLFIELTAPNYWEESMKRSGHLTPNLLKQELLRFRDMKNYLPDIIVLHILPGEEKTIKAETLEVAGLLGVPIQFAREGLQITV
jgi:ribonuclease BN (tRNA processing enzyme)